MISAVSSIGEKHTPTVCYARLENKQVNEYLSIIGAAMNKIVVTLPSRDRL